MRYIIGQLKVAFFKNDEITTGRTAGKQNKQILQTLSVESHKRLIIDFKRHFRLGWSHYRLLQGQKDILRKSFSSRQASSGQAVNGEI